MKKVLGNILTIIVIILIIGMSVLLLSYNEYRVSEFGNKTLLIIDEDMLDFKAGSLAIVTGTDQKNVKPGDYIFYYDTSSTTVKTRVAQVQNIYQEKLGEISFTMADNYILSGEHVIGKVEDTKAINKLGSILAVLESKWGFLFLVIVPALLLFVYEIINVIIEIKTMKLRKQKVVED